MSNFINAITQFEEFPLDDSLVGTVESIIAIMGEPNDYALDVDDEEQLVEMSWENCPACSLCVENEARMITVVVSKDDIFCQKIVIDVTGELVDDITDGAVNYFELKEWLEENN